MGHVMSDDAASSSPSDTPKYTPEEKARILSEESERIGRLVKDKAAAEMAAWEAQKRQAELDKARDEYLRKRDRISWQTTADPEIHCTDFGNALRFMKHYGKSVLYCPPQDQWYLWNGDGYWRKDSLLLIQHMVREMLQNIYNETQYVGDPDRRTMLAKWAIQCEHPQHISSCLKELMKMPSISVPADKFDRDIYLFNFRNGTYDLRSHVICQHDRENHISRQVQYGYDPAATCPEFLKFLDRIFRSRDDKKDIISYLQKAVGYSLTGDASKQVIFLLYGSGANGKSTLIETLRKLMGEYGTTISANALTTKKNDSVRNDIARLVNIRFVASSENAIGTTLDEELIKNLTGGDQVAARFLFQEEFLFYPHLKLWWAFNHPPGIRDMTHSLWRRLKMIPFEERIPDKEQIPQLVLLAKFEKELPGIFNWAITGLKKFQETGLADVSAVLNAVKEFKENQDVLFDYLNERCEIIDQSQIVGDLKVDTAIRASTVYNDYVDWAAKNNEKIISQKKFSMLLLERGIKRTHKNTGSVFYGIKLRNL